jgi:hypothetical protein
MPNAFGPYPYQNPQHPLLHSGSVTFTISREIDLGIGHDNFIVAPTLMADTAAEVNVAPQITWERVAGKPGVFKLFAWKATAAGTTTLIAATAACTVSFVAIAGASVS